MIINKNEAILEWLETCPYIVRKGSEYVSLEYLNKDIRFSINDNPMMNNGLISKDILGNETRAYSFTFSAMFKYTQDVAEMLQNSSFFELMEDWINEQNDKNNFPDYKLGKSIQVIQSPFIFKVDENQTQAQYIIMIQYIYRNNKL